MSLYDTLGVDKHATEQEIRQAYRRKAQQSHPDKAEGSKEAFQAVAEAYEVLVVPERRKQYDETGSTAPEATLQEKILENLAALVTRVMTDLNDLDYTNPLEAMLSLITEHEKNVENNLIDRRRQLKKNEKALRRLKFKGAGTNFIASMLQQRNDMLLAGCAKDEEQKLIAKGLRDLLKTYEYQTEGMSEKSEAAARIFATHFGFNV